MHLRAVAQRRFGVRAVPTDGAVGVHAVAVLEARDFRPDSRDDTAHIGARCVRQVRLADVRTGTDVGIHRIDAHGFHLHHDLSRSRDGIWDILELHDFRRSELTNDDGFHGGPV